MRSSTTCSWHGGPGWGGSQVELNWSWTLLPRTIAGIMSQLMAVEASDSCGRVVASCRLVDGVAAEAWATETRSCRARCH